MEILLCIRRPGELDIFSVAKQKLIQNVIAFYKYTRRLNIKEGKDLLKIKYSVGTRTNGHKLPVNVFELEAERHYVASCTISAGESRLPVQVWGHERVCKME